MEIELTKKPRKPTIIGGFPGFGLVGMIATEYLINHLDTIEIGRIWSNKLPAIVAIQDSELVQPLQIFYNKKYNLVIVQGLAAMHGSEWEISEAVAKLAMDLKAKEIITLEGIGSAAGGDALYAYSTDAKKRTILAKDFTPMKKGIIVGITGALLVNTMDKKPAVCFLAETQSGLPDSKAASKLIAALDKYLGLGIDYKPLLKQAAVFESKLKGLLSQSKQAVTANKAAKAEQSYFG
tara:strand:- start:22 stop:732 length:711 start_codon:yes stop_codon:yes gene_type:complete